MNCLNFWLYIVICYDNIIIWILKLYSLYVSSEWKSYENVNRYWFCFWGCIFEIVNFYDIIYVNKWKYYGLNNLLIDGI